jgi:hypothetical protein
MIQRCVFLAALGVTAVFTFILMAIWVVLYFLLWAGEQLYDGFRYLRRGLY